MYGQLLVGRHSLAAGNAARAAFAGTHALPAVARHLLVGNSHLESISPQADVSAIGLYLSGGLANADPNTSFGGQISSTPFEFQSFTLKTTLPGITVNRIANSSIGTGVLRYEERDDGYLLQWVPSGSGTASGRVVRGSGKYGVLTANGVGTGFAVVDVAWDSLASGVVEAEVEVRNVVANIFSSVTAPQAETGYTSYRCVYIKNEHTTETLTGLQLITFRSGNTGSVLTVAADPAGAGNGVSTGIATTPSSETSSPSLGFSVAATLDDLLPGQTVAFWMRREIHEGWYKELNPDVHLLLLKGGF